MTKAHYMVVFLVGGDYRIASSWAKDQHGRFSTKVEALLAARAAQARVGADPNFVLDLTNAGPEELAEYLR